jgi:hypothetical protein
MLRAERADLSATTLDPSLLAGVEDSSFKLSMLYSVLPTVVSNRLSLIPSLRQSLNDVRNRGCRSKFSSVTELPQPETPPPGYFSIPPSGTATPYRLSVALGEADQDFVDDGSERPSSSRSTLPSAFDTYETSTGIRWRYASLGENRLLRTGQRDTNSIQAQALWRKHLKNRTSSSVAPTRRPQH